MNGKRTVQKEECAEQSEVVSGQSNAGGAGSRARRLSSLEQEWTINLALFSRLCGAFWFIKTPTKT